MRGLQAPPSAPAEVGWSPEGTPADRWALTSAHHPMRLGLPAGEEGLRPVWRVGFDITEAGTMPSQPFRSPEVPGDLKSFASPQHCRTSDFDLMASPAVVDRSMFDATHTVVTCGVPFLPCVFRIDRQVNHLVLEVHGGGARPTAQPGGPGLPTPWVRR